MRVDIWAGCRRFLMSLLLCAYAFLGSNPAQAAIAILDPLIVFEGGRKQFTVRVVNGGGDATTCRITVVNLRKQSDGSFIEVAEPAPTDRFADKFVRVSPRQVTIMAGAQQVVRLSIRMPPDLPPGEYKSYLKIEELPQPAQAGSAQIGVSVALVHHLPITIRHPGS